MTFGIMWLLTEALRMLTDSYDTGWAFPLLSYAVGSVGEPRGVAEDDVESPTCEKAC